MKLLLLISHLFQKKIKSYLLLSFEIIISSVIFLSLIGKMQYEYDTKDIAYTFQNSNAYYFVPHFFYDTEEQSIDTILKKKWDVSYDIGEIYEIMFHDSKETIYTAYGYNDPILSFVDFQLEDGIWFDKATPQEYVPVISLNPKLKTGDIISLTEYSSPPQCKAIVIGELKKDSYVLSFYQGASTDFSELSYFVSHSNADLIIPYQSSQYKNIPDENIVNKSLQYGSIIIAKDDKFHKELYNICSDYGYLSNINIMKENYLQNKKEFFLSNGIVLAIFTLLTIVGIAGFNGIQSISNERLYTIYYMLGLNQKKCMLMEALKMTLFLIINYILITVLYKWKLHSMFDVNSFKITTETFIAIYLFIFCICFFSTVGYVYQLGKKNLIQIYKNKA